MTERKSAEERTADLLKSAESILAESGRLTVSRITAQAGIASGTFYLYYPSKGHLEATLIERFMDGFVQVARDAIGRQGPWTQRLHAAFEAMVGYAIDHRAVFRLQVTHTPTPETRATIAAGVDNMKALLESALSEADTRGQMVVADPVMTAAVLFHGMEGVLRGAVTFDRAMDRDALTQALHGLVSSLAHQSA